MALPDEIYRSQDADARQMLKDLGGLRREHVSTRDDDRRTRQFARVTTKQLEENRAINQEGSTNARQAVEDRSALSAWSNLQHTLQDLDEVEDLQDIMGGQSHRARLNHEIQMAGGQTYSRPVADEKKFGNSRPSSHVSQEQIGRGRSGTNIITPHSDQIISTERPLDPAIDPDREYHLTRKGRNTGSKARSTTSKGSSNKSSRVMLPSSGNIPEFLLAGAAAHRAGGHRVSRGRVPPSPAVPLADPDDFMASVARNKAAVAGASQNVSPTRPEESIQPVPMSSQAQGDINAVSTQGSLVEPRNPDASKVGALAGLPATHSLDISRAPQTSMSAASSRAARPSNVTESFDVLLSGQNQPSPISSATAADQETTHKANDQPQTGLADPMAFLTHIGPDRHAPPKSKASPLYKNHVTNTEEQPSYRHDRVAPSQTIAEVQQTASSGTQGLPSSVSEHAALFNEETFDDREGVKETTKVTTPLQQASVENTSPANPDVFSSDHQSLPVTQELGQNATSAMVPNVSATQPDLIDTSNDFLTTETLKPSEVKKPLHRINVGGYWYVLEHEMDKTDTTSVPDTKTKEASRADHDKPGSHDSSRRVSMKQQYTASNRPPAYGRGQHQMRDELLENYKDSTMKHHNMSEDEYQKLSRQEKVLLAQQSIHPQSCRKPEAPIPRPKTVLAVARNSPKSGLRPVETVTNMVQDQKSSRSDISDISHGIENIRISSPTRPVTSVAASSGNPFDNHVDDSVYRQGSGLSALSASRFADPNPSVRSVNISAIQSSIAQGSPRSAKPAFVHSGGGFQVLESASKAPNAPKPGLTEQAMRKLAQGSGSKNVPDWLRSDLLSGANVRQQIGQNISQAISERSTSGPSQGQVVVESAARSDIRPIAQIATRPAQTMSASSSQGLRASKYAS